MLNLIRAFLRTGTPVKRLFRLIFWIWVGIAALGFIIEMKTISIPVLFFCSPVIINKIKARIDKSKEMETVPYWGKFFGLRQTIRLLASDSLKPYVMQDGTVSKKLMVSNSGRWFYVAGRFYPTHLVRRFDRSSERLYMINNAVLKNQYWLDDDEVRKALNELLYSKKAYLFRERKNSKGSDCERAFANVWKGSLEDLAKADWDELRYRWEQELADIEADRMERSAYNKHMEGLKTAKTAQKEMYGRVLLDQEIEVIAEAVLDGRIEDTDGWFDISLFKNDIYVMNGVKLAKRLGYPINANAVEFLFGCISDIQKPYFEEAVIALERMPQEVLVPIIEKYVTQAHDEGDVVFGAGLLYLSKRIGYEISLKKDPSGKVVLEESDNEFEKMVLAQGRM